MLQTSVGVCTYAVCAVLAFLGQCLIGEVLSPPESVLASKRCLLCYCSLVFRPTAAPFEVCEEQLASHGVQHLEVIRGRLRTCIDKIIICNENWLILLAFFRPSISQKVSQ